MSISVVYLKQVARLEPETIAKAREELQPLQAALEQVLQEQKAYSSGGSDGKTGSISGKRGDNSIDERSAVVSLFQRTQAIDDYGPMLPGLIARLRSLQVLTTILVFDWASLFLAVSVCLSSHFFPRDSRSSCLLQHVIEFHTRSDFYCLCDVFSSFLPFFFARLVFYRECTKRASA